MTKLALKYRILIILTPVIILLDQWTKLLTVKHFYYGESISIIDGFFNLTYVQNKGAAFGILSKAPDLFRIPFFLAVPVVAMIFILMIFKKLAPNSIKLSTALSLVIGGAIGNFIDRIRLGYVIDFLDFHWKWNYHFPAFNIADSAICVGVGLLMLDLLFTKELEASEGNNASHSV